MNKFIIISIAAIFLSIVIGFYSGLAFASFNVKAWEQDGYIMVEIGRDVQRHYLN